MRKLFVAILLMLGIALHGATYDCFTFFNELELLKMRLHELNDVVDYFVIVEGKKSFTGNDKPLHFKENAADFEQYKDKIIHLVIEQFPPSTGDMDRDHWDREAYSRNYMMNALEHCQDDDIIFISDLDEIPRKTSVIEIQNYQRRMIPKKRLLNRRKRGVKMEEFVCNLDMRLFSLSMNREYSVSWCGGCKAVPYWFLKTHTPWDIKVYHHSHTGMPKFANAGWHFNGMGGDKRVLEKWKNTAPVSGAEEFLKQLSVDEDFLKQTVQSHRDAHTHTVEIDDSYPQYFLENLEYFRSLGWIWEEE